MLTIYKASAGSGKTFTLAKTYITELLGVPRREQDDSSGYRTYRVLNRADSKGSQLQENNRHRGILAITFTRKATEEMKTRILNELHKLTIVQPDDSIKSDYAAGLLDLFNEHPLASCTPRQLAQTAKIALQQILFDYRNFHVSTIDSFFQQVLRTFARELDFKSNYNVEIEDDAVMSASVAALFDAFNNGSIKAVESYDKNLRTLEDWLYRFMLDALRSGKKAELFNRNSATYRGFVRQIGKINEESFKPYRESMETFLQEGLLGQFERHLDRLIADNSRSMMAKAREFAMKYGLKADMFSFATANGLMEQIFNPAAKPLAMSDIAKLRKSQAGKALLGEGDKNPLKKGTPQQYLEPAVHMFATLAHQICETNALEIIKKSLPQLWMLSYTLHYRDEYLRENDLLQLSSSNELVHRIVKDGDTPFVYERMGVDLHHFLIDEFQDTSFLQWANLRPLVANALSQQEDSLVIGDEKQAIYRFRNSDASILHEKIYGHMRGYDIVTKGTRASENTNYRSSGTIVRFNNTLFSRLASMLHVSEFDNVIQDIRPGYDRRPGYVRFSPSEDKLAALDQMAQEILRQHDQGHYRWREIAILVNKTKEGVEAVNYLTVNYPQIPVLSGEALRLNASPAIQLILSILRIIDQELSASTDKQRQIAINNIEYTLAIALGHLEADDIADPETVTGLILDAIDESLPACSDGNPGTPRRNNAVEKIMNERPASLVAMVETIIDKQFSTQQRARQYSYLTAFQDCVISFCKRCQGGLHAFLDWWDTHGDKAAVNGASEADAVTVMTIHKSKGLEFKCVHIPFVNWPLYWMPSKVPSLWVAGSSLPLSGLDCPKPPAFCIQLESVMDNASHPMHKIYEEERRKYLVDTLNKTYVAFTRPMVELTAWYTTAPTRTPDPVIDLILSAMQQPAGSDNELISDLSGCLSESADGSYIFAMGAPTVSSDAMNTRTDAQCANSDPYPVVQRTDKATDIRLEDALSLDDINSDDPAPTASGYTVPVTASDWIDDTARQQGLVLHDIMSQIHDLDDITTAVERVCSRKGLSADQTLHYEKLLNGFLNPDRDDIAHWFAGNAVAYIEQPIYIPDLGQVRRPDRIVVYDDGSADILDYKFTDNRAIVGCDEHQKQIIDYIWYVRQMGYKPVRGFLCYPMLDEIVPCHTLYANSD